MDTSSRCYMYCYMFRSHCHCIFLFLAPSEICLVRLIAGGGCAILLGRLQIERPGEEGRKENLRSLFGGNCFSLKGS